MVTLYPGKSYIKNIGFDSSGTHCGEIDTFNINLNTKFIFKKIKSNENLEARKKIELFLKKTKPSILAKFKNIFQL